MAGAGVPAVGFQSYTIGEGTDFDQELVVGPDLKTVMNQVETVSVDLAREAPAVEASAVVLEADADAPAAKVSSSLEGSSAGKFVDVVIAFRRHERIPALPRRVPGVAREAEPNRTILEQRHQLLDEVASSRMGHLSDSMSLVQKVGGVYLDYHVVGNALSARVPAWAIPVLASDPEVAFIEAAQTTTPPPDTDPLNDVDDGRRIVNSDPFWTYGFTGAGTNQYVGILDTGVRSSHTLLSIPDRIDWALDCVYGGIYCESTGNPNYSADDSCWNHGTSTAAIVTGSTYLGSAYRGVTDALVDSFKVYTCAGLNVSAAIKAFGAAVGGGDDVIVAQIQQLDSELGALANAADDAYDGGAIVVAPVGDEGPLASTVTSPGNAHKVLGVGAFDVKTLATQGYQGRGPCADGRIKPDLQAPTNTETASTSCSTCLHTYGGTSGAAPYAAGEAMLLYDYFNSLGWATNPGLIYAAMLAFGSRVYPDFDNVQGVGNVVMGDLSCRHWVSGSRSVGDGLNVDIPFTTSTSGNGDRDLRVAIWWPEEGSYHNDIDLSVLDPTGRVRTYSQSTPSVFEFVTVPGALTPAGTWRVRLNGFSVPHGPQTVYFLMYNKTGCAP